MRPSFGSNLPQIVTHICQKAIFKHALGIDKKEVSLGGTLSLAFASRGNGGNGPATYDPKHHVINFTREGGAGSLAREWAHALDYYIGKSCRLGVTGTEVPVSGCPGLKGVPTSVTALLRGLSSKRERLTPEEQLKVMKENHDSEVKIGRAHV